MVIYNQRSLADPDAGEACGECALATALGITGIATNPLLILSQLRAKFGHAGTAGGTDQNELGWYCASVGVDWTWSATAGVPGVLAGLNAGHPVLVAIHDNTNGDPGASGTFRHWILAYRDNGNGSIQCANSWASTATAPTGRDVAYSTTTLATAMFESMEIHRSPVVNPSPVPAGGNNPAPASAPTPGDDMTTSMAFTHLNLSRHSLSIRADGAVHHTVWNAGANPQQTESMPVGTLKARAVIDFFTEPNGQPVAIVEGTDGNEWFTTTLSWDANLAVEAGAGWVQR